MRSDSGTGHRRHGDTGWSYLAGALGLAAIEVMFTFWTGRTLGITSHLIGIPVTFPLVGARGTGELVLAGALLVGGMVGGAALGAVRGGEWRLRLPRRWQPAVLAGMGGLLMGVGARLAPGCNVGGVMGGIVSSSLQGWVEGVFMVAGALVGIRVALAAESRTGRSRSGR
ncbi:MAG: YeeE/YedE thiosulfate transporter family protein [Bacillota bacterium]|nr:YeeE/YedE thiosulfate transporter family protein [Bacillota bacterium]